METFTFRKEETKGFSDKNKIGQIGAPNWRGTTAELPRLSFPGYWLATLLTCLHPLHHDCPMNPEPRYGFQVQRMFAVIYAKCTWSLMLN